MPIRNPCVQCLRFFLNGAVSISFRQESQFKFRSQQVCNRVLFLNVMQQKKKKKDASAVFFSPSWKDENCQFRH